jgi:oligopeptide/dipeptide ABC transporter ATP-binding protein
VSEVVAELVGVTKRFGDKVAVDDVSLRIHRGRTLGIVGESGSGKSTIGRLLVGLETPTSGSILVRGAPLPTRYGAMREVRRTMAMVFQNPTDALDPHLPVWRVVTEPFLAAGRSAEATRGRAAQLLEMVGLSGVDPQRRAATFSGGEQQRIGFARALALDPQLIVCDEPTSSLDVSVQAQVLNVMLELQARTDVAFVLISHDLHVVRRMSHDLLVLLDGRVMERGDADHVSSAPAHPYTRALLDAVPRARWEPLPASTHPPGVTEARAHRASGVATSSADAGCPFRDRCPDAMAVCATTPALLPMPDDPDRHLACHLTTLKAG